MATKGQDRARARGGSRGGDGGRGGFAEEKRLERGEHMITVESILRKSVTAGFGTKESKLIG